MTITTPILPAPLASSIVAPTNHHTVYCLAPVRSVGADVTTDATDITGNDHGRFETMVWTAVPAFGTKGHSQRARPT